MTRHRKRYILFSALLGAAILAVLSALQKSTLGFPLKPMGFIVPSFFGFFSGAIIGIWHSKVHFLKQELECAYAGQVSSLQNIITTAPVGIFQSTPEGHYRSVNETFAAMLGYKKEELLDNSISIADLYFDPNDREEVKRLLAKDKELTDHHILAVRKDGSHMWMSIFVKVQFDDSGFYYDGFTLDITDRKLAEDALAISEERFRSLLENVDMVAVQGYDENRKVIFWNRASETLYGYSREEVFGKRLEELIIPEPMRSEVVRLVEDWIENGNVIPAAELDLLHKDGSLVPVYSSHVMQENAEGGKELYCIDVELTEIRKAQDQLLKAKEEAERANRIKSGFLANMSHEIRTPLNGIMGMLQLLDTGEQSKENHEYIQLALQSSRRLTQLLSDILDLSRVEADKLVINNRPLDCRKIVREVCTLFKLATHETNITLQYHMHPAIPAQVLGDSVRLQQVLHNLVGNSLKFTDRGEVFIEVYPLPTSAKGIQRVLFSVSDTGSGIPDEHVDDLFEPFTQLSSGFSRTHQGAGLGLAICKKLVNLMGGNIAVVSELGKGTTVHFCISFGVDDSLPHFVPSEDTLGILSPSKLTVLLAEDDRVSGIATKRLLENVGFSVTVVGDGKQALEALLNKTFDILLMDVQMPNMDGIAATKAIRAGAAGKDKKDIPILAMTAYAMSGDKEKFLKAGMDGYVSKPLEMETLLETLQEVQQGAGNPV